MNKTTKNIKTWVLAASLGLGAAVSAHAQSSVIVRTSSFEYDADGLLIQEVIEPDSPQHCLQTTHSYNAQGNPSGTSSSPCAGASGHTISSAGTRSTTKEYLAQTVVIGQGSEAASYTTPAGTFATSTTNTLNQSESYEYDPRHGQVTKLTGPNGGVTTWTYDGFGRKTRENRADGTYTLWEYHRCQPPTLPDGAYGPHPVDSACAASVSNAGLTHLPDWYIKEVSYGTNDMPLAAAKYQIHDALGRVVRVRSDSFLAEGYAAYRFGSIQDTVYNALGQTAYKSIAYLRVGGNPQWTSYEYDAIGRLTKETSPDGSGGTAVLQTAYNGLQTVVTNALNQVKTIYMSASGQTERIEDALGTPVQYTYDALGQLTETNANGSITKLTYDVRGRKTGMQDPAMGRWDYAYNAFGELVWQQDSLSQVVTMQYDPLGRMSNRTEPDLVSNWYYDQRADGSSCGAGIGKLCEATANNGYRRLHTYDTMGRPTSTSNVLDNAAQPAVTSQVYDSVTGRLIEQTWPTGYKAIYEYTTVGTNWSAGHLWRVRGMDGSTQNALWQAMDKDPQGRLIRYQSANGVVTLRDIEQATGRTRSIKGTLDGQADGNVLNLSYSDYDKLGNLKNRSDANTGVTEAFSYDQLNRLSETTTMGGSLAEQSRVQVLYDARGNIQYKSDVGYYHYDGQRPNRLTQITTTGSLAGVTVNNTGTRALAYAFDDYLPGVRNIDLGQGNVAMGNGNLMYTVSQDSASGAHTIRWEEYTSFNKIRQMRFGSLSNPNDPTNAVADRTVDLVYGPEHQRLRQTVQLTSNAPAHMEAGTTWYMNGPDSLGLSYEKEIKANGLIEHKHYLSAGGEVFGQYTKREGSLNGKPAQQVSYFHQDHLGSLSAITNEVGQVIERLAYDPWGKRRYTDGNRDNNDTLTSSNTKRGFTMHEHMDEMGVINMNGRVDDPMIGRFLTADPYIQAPDFLQSFNRYAYVWNNPLGMTDATGFFGGDAADHGNIGSNGQVGWGGSSGSGSRSGSERSLPTVTVRERALPPDGNVISGSRNGNGSDRRIGSGRGKVVVAVGTFGQAPPTTKKEVKKQRPKPDPVAAATVAVAPPPLLTPSVPPSTSSPGLSMPKAGVGLRALGWVGLALAPANKDTNEEADLARIHAMQDALGVNDAEGTADRPPAGSLGIDQTEWSGDHQGIKLGIGAGAADDVRIDPLGNVWGENPDGTWTNHGQAGDYTGSGRPSGQRGRDRDRERDRRRGR
jgi:RHS repeat-associated protein